MSCDEPLCRLNSELLEMLPMLEVERQQHILRRWCELDLAERDALLCEIRRHVSGEPDLIALAKLAGYFQCDIYDLVRYTRSEGGTKEGD